MTPAEREFFIENLLVGIHFIIEMIWWTGLAPWELEFPFPGSLASTFLVTPVDFGDTQGDFRFEDQPGRIQNWG